MCYYSHFRDEKTEDFEPLVPVNSTAMASPSPPHIFHLCQAQRPLAPISNMVTTVLKLCFVQLSSASSSPPHKGQTLGEDILSIAQCPQLYHERYSEHKPHP